MDRLYAIDKETIEIFEADGRIIEYICSHYAHHYCDKYFTYNDITQLDKNIVLNGIKYKVIPLANIEKTSIFLKQNYNVNMIPIEIPTILQQFSPDYKIFSGEELLKNHLNYDNNQFFIKRIDKLKSWNNLLYNDYYDFIETNGIYSVSPRQNILSEYRIFVYKNNIVGCCHYSGNSIIFPSTTLIQTMVSLYNTVLHPDAYTLDVAVTDKQTFPLEVHPMVSCGLYGFQDSVLLNMWDAGLNWYINTKLSGILCENGVVYKSNESYIGKRAKLHCIDD